MNSTTNTKSVSAAHVRRKVYSCGFSGIVRAKDPRRVVEQSVDARADGVLFGYGERRSRPASRRSSVSDRRLRISPRDSAGYGVGRLIPAVEATASS
jgi:hypothetical protein